LKRFLIILFVLLSLAISAQVGGRMKERKNQKRFIKHIAKSGWHYNPTRPGKVQNYRREGRQLFHRNITRGKKFKYKYQAKLNRDRVRKRVRGNLVFHKKKYKRT